MSQTQIFNHPKFGQVEITLIDGKEHFGATQSAKVLGYVNPHKAIIDHCRKDGVTKREVIDSLGRPQEMNFITEGNLYRLITKSKLPDAEKFESWVFDEVLPQIRKTGSYQVTATPSYMIEDPIDRATQWIEEARQKKLLEEQNTHKDQQLTLQAPKVALYDVAMCAGNDQSISKVAKSLNYGPNKLFRLLREKKVLFGNNTPYQRYIDAGYFTVRQVPITRTDSIMNVTQPLVTAKGIAWIHKLLQEVGETA